MLLVPSFIFMLSALYMKVRNRSRSRIARESRQRRQRSDLPENRVRWPFKKTPLQAPSQQAAQPDFLLLCLSMIHFAGLESLTSCVTEKKRKQSNAMKNRRSYQHHPSAARGKARPPQQAAISFLPLCHTYSILYTVIQKSNLLLHL